MVEDIKEFPIFLLGCNFLTYLKTESREQLIKTISEKFDKKSILKIGEFYFVHNIDRLLCEHGFEQYKRIGYFKKII